MTLLSWMANIKKFQMRQQGKDKESVSGCGEKEDLKKSRRLKPSRISSECVGKLPGDWRQSVLLLCGSYLSQGGSEQIGANGTARVCFMSQHTAEAWAPHHRLSLASTPVCFMLECRPSFYNLRAQWCVWLSTLNSAHYENSLFYTCVKKKMCMQAVGFKTNVAVFS